MKCLNNEYGVVPLLVPIAIAICSMLFGAGIYAYLSGSAKIAILLFISGVIFGLVILPNLKSIIRWFKSVKKEI